MLLQRRNFMFRRTILRCLWIVSMFRDKQKQALKFKRRPSMIIGTGMETRHCLNHGSVWDVSRRSTKIHQKDICGFKADWRRNGSQQDQETRVRKSAQTCQKAHSVKPCRKWAEAKPQIGGNATREQRGIYSFPNNARRKLKIRRASAMPCRVTTPANPDGSSWVRPCASKLSKMETKRQKSSCSKQEHENILIEWERLRTTKSRTTSGMEVTFPCRTTTWCTNRFPNPRAMKNCWGKGRPRQGMRKHAETTSLGRVQSDQWRMGDTQSKICGQHFSHCYIMDLCHLKNCELEKKLQKYEGTVVLGGFVCEKRFWNYAVLTEQGASALHMTAAKVLDVISILPGCSGQASNAVRAYTQVETKDALQLLHISDEIVQRFGSDYRQNWDSNDDPVVPLERHLYGHPLSGLWWETIFKKRWWRRIGQITRWYCP